MKKVTAICPICGESFSYFPSSYPDKPKVHCSKKCFHAASWITKDCPMCGKSFTRRRSDPTDCCSKTCGRRLLNLDKHITFNCDQCGKELTKKMSDYRPDAPNHFCSLRCFGDWQKVNIPAHITARRVDPVERACKECGKTFKIAPAQLTYKGYGSFCSHVCKGRWYGARTPHPPPPRPGALNHNWKGGQRFRNYGPSWRSQRRAARKRDGYTCQCCGINEIDMGVELSVHHLQPFREFGLARHEEANQLGNLVSLCSVCHRAIEPPA